MSRRRNMDWKAAVIGYCAPLLLSLGMSLTLLSAMLPQTALWPAALQCGLFTLGFYALFQIKIKRKWLLPLAALLGLGAWFLLGGGPIFQIVQLVKAAFLSFRGVPDAVAPFADTARWAVCLLFSLLAAALCWDHTLPLVAFTVITVIAMAFLFDARRELVLYAAPAAAGLLLMLAEDQGKRSSAVAAAAALAILAFLALPARAQSVSPFRETADSIRQFVEDYLLFNQYRSTFSLAAEGYQPLEERLGGPAEPEDHTVMQVATDRVVLLRGKTYDDYSGLNWYDSLSARRYLSVSPRYAALREELFDLNRPLSGDGTMLPQTLRVHMLNAGPTTLFAPARTRTLQLEGERMVLYYNLAGEYFLTRDLAPGDSYTVTYMPYAPGDQETREAVSACAGMEDSHYDEVMALYLTVPRHIQQEIYDIAARATAGCETPYEKALGIQEYLRTHYQYNLKVQYPPDGVDFLAWFLIGEKQGYCTYFATAMTMLSRIAGLPARYVTGYLAVPDENGMAVVTGEDAHAWAEIYFEGFGWLDFDATPRTDNNRNREPNPDSTVPPNPTPSPEPTSEPTATPEPSPEPQETPTPEPPENQDNPSDNPPSPTPPPEEGATPSPEPETPPEEEGPRQPPFPWWIIALILALCALLTWRIKATEPLRRAKRRPDQGADILFAEITRLLKARGIQKKPQETLHDFARRADVSLAEAHLPPLLPLADSYAAQVYGRHAAEAKPFAAVFTALWKAASPMTRCRLALRRVFQFK